MRLVFLLIVLAAGLFYSWYAFVELGFLTRSGRLGPGFFPRFVGAGMVAVTLLSIVSELRTPHPKSEEPGFAKPVAIIIGLGVVYLIGLSFLGGVIGTMVFLFVATTLFNRGAMITNTVVSLAVPLAVYLLFVVFLNADMPDGYLPFLL